jgi:hypothetical protein
LPAIEKAGKRFFARESQLDKALASVTDKSTATLLKADYIKS